MNPTLKRKLANKRRKLAAQRQGLLPPESELQFDLQFVHRRVLLRLRAAKKQATKRQRAKQARELRKHQEKLLKVAARAGWGAQTRSDVKALVQQHNEGAAT